MPTLQDTPYFHGESVAKHVVSILEESVALHCVTPISNRTSIESTSKLTANFEPNKQNSSQGVSFSTICTSQCKWLLCATFASICNVFSIQFHIFRIHSRFIAFKVFFLGNLWFTCISHIAIMTNMAASLRAYKLSGHFSPALPCRLARLNCPQSLYLLGSARTQCIGIP